MSTSVSLQISLMSAARCIILGKKVKLLLPDIINNMEKFSDLVLKTVKTIPKGKVASYGQVALMAGEPRAARQVGWILNQKSDEQTPWWRVINNSGRISIKHPEYSALLQKELLEKESVKVSDDFGIDIEKYRMRD